MDPKGTKLKTEMSNSYQLFTETMILYDFKKDISYTLVTYIKEIKRKNKTILYTLR